MGIRSSVSGRPWVLLPLAVGLAACPSFAPAASSDQTLPGRFGRMFGNLSPFAAPTPEVRSALLELGKQGGLLDAKDDLTASPAALILVPDLSRNNPNSTSHTAGLTFVGQFLDHDITFDTSSRLGQPTRPATASNARSPALDLDSVYGDGPTGSPILYDAKDRSKLRIESGGSFEDLPRDANGTALIADPRNDENLVIAGLQEAFILFHNRAVDVVRSQNPSIADDAAYRVSRQQTTWHYQWMILHDFLPAFVGQATVDDIVTNGRRFYKPARDRAFIPVEFQIAYRFGHSMVRPSYRANLAGDNGQAFFAMLFEPNQEGQSDPDDLRGGSRSSRRFIGWQTFFDFGDGQVRPNKAIDTRISTPLFNLPLGAIASGDPPTSLAQRNLLRHLTWQVPSGQAIAREMGLPALSKASLAELRSIYPSFDASTPLWYYVLKEAELVEGGRQLGPVGGRLVAEVFIGLLQTDPACYLNVRPDWVPTLSTRSGNPRDFHMIDFLTFAGVDPGSRGQ
jgi:Animal haem peroxidase